MAPRGSEEVLVTSLGDLFKGPHEHKYWSSKRGRNRYPYPVGYQATRLQGGQEYQLEVAAGPYGPEFVVTDPRGVCFSAETALRVWSIALRSNGKAGHIKENTDAGEIFGFNQPMVKKYLQDLVAKAEPHASVATTSAPLLSPSGCNTPKVSRGKRKTTPKETPKALPAKASPSLKASPSHEPKPKSASAKRPASARASKRHAKKSKGETAEDTHVVGPATGSLLEAADRKLSQNLDLGSDSGEGEGGGKRQKLGELPFASGVIAKVEDKSTGAVGETSAETHLEKVRHSRKPVPLKRDGETPSLDGGSKRRKRGEVQSVSRGGGKEDTRVECEEQIEQHAEASAEEAHSRLEPVLLTRIVGMTSAGEEVEGGSKRQKPGELQCATRREIAELEDVRVEIAGVRNTEASRAGPAMGAPAECTAGNLAFGPKPAPLGNGNAEPVEESGGLPGVAGEGEMAEESGEAEGSRARLAVEKQAKLREREVLRASLEANRAKLARSRAIRAWRLEQEAKGEPTPQQTSKKDAPTGHIDTVEGLPQCQRCEEPAGESDSKTDADDEKADRRWEPSDGPIAAAGRAENGELGVSSFDGVESAARGANSAGKRGPFDATGPHAANGLSEEQTGAIAEEESEHGPVEEQARSHPLPKGSNAGTSDVQEQRKESGGKVGVGRVELGRHLGSTSDSPSGFTDGLSESRRKDDLQATEANGSPDSKFDPKVETGRPSKIDESGGDKEKPELRQGWRPEGPEECPNHQGGCDRLSWVVDMEAETEGESEASQSFGARGRYLGRRGDVEAEGFPAGVGETGADVRIGRASGVDVTRVEVFGADGGGNKEPSGRIAGEADMELGACKEAGGCRKVGLEPLEVSEPGQRRSVDSLGLHSDEDERGFQQPKGSRATGIGKPDEQVCSLGCNGRSGQQGEFVDGSGRQDGSADETGRHGGFVDDSTEPADFSIASPGQLEGELPPSPVEGLRPEGQASAFVFEGESAGWFTAVRGRNLGSLAGLLGLPGADRARASGRMEARTPTTRGRDRLTRAGCNADVTKGMEQSMKKAEAAVNTGAPGLGLLDAKPRNKRRKSRSLDPLATPAVPVAGRKGNGRELRTDGNQTMMGSKRQVCLEGVGGTGEPPSAEHGQLAFDKLDETLHEEGVKKVPAALRSQHNSPISSQGKQKRTRRLSLTPFKAAMEWMATEEGKATAEKLKADVGVGGEGQPNGKGGEKDRVEKRGGGKCRSAKTKMGCLKRLSTLGWGAEKGAGAELEPTGFARVARGDKNKPVEVAASVSAGTGDDQTVGREAPLNLSDRSNPVECGNGLVRRLQGMDAVAGDAAVSELGETTEKHGHVEREMESKGERGVGAEKLKERTVRIVGSDSLTEQQTETEAEEGVGAEALGEAAVGSVKVGAELTAVKRRGDLGNAHPKLRELATPEEPFQKEYGGRENGANERLEADTAGVLFPSEVVAKAEATEAVNDESVKGGLMRLGAHSNVPLPNNSGGQSCIDGLPQDAPSGRSKARSDGLTAGPMSTLAVRSPASSGDHERGGSWFGRAVDKVSSAFTAQPGYKPLTLTRSRNSVSNGAGEAHPAKVDTNGKDWSEKSRPRNKSWPTWTGPTTNLNLVTASGSARKAPRERRATADVSRMTSLSDGNARRGQSKALESQAQRFGRFEESEAVRDWLAGDFLVPSTPPESPSKEEALEMNGPGCSGRKEADLRQKGVETEGPVNGYGETMCAVQKDAQTVGQGLQRDGLLPVCCLVHQTGPVLWTVVHVAGQLARLGVCIQTNKAERSVFVYSLRAAAEPSDWKVDVVGELSGTVRSSEDPEQVSSSVPFLEFSLDGEVLVVSDALVLNGLSPGEAASKRPCIRLVSLVQQRPQVLARLECVSATSCLLAAGPRLLATGEKQGVVECWKMSEDWRSHHERWSLPVARYQGVTFPAIRQLMKVPGRANHLLGCSENGSFALWDTLKHTLLSTCHPMYHVISSAHVLSIPLPVAKELRRKATGSDVDTETAVCTGTAGHSDTSLHNEAAFPPGADKQAGISVKAGEGPGFGIAGHTEKRILTGSPPHDVGVEADGGKPLCLLVRATERQDPGKGASCCVALLEGDGIAVGKELLVAKSSVHLAALGGTGVAVDDLGRILLWDASSGRAVALLRDLEGANLSSVSTQEEAGILAVGARDGRVAIYSRGHEHRA